MKTSKTIWVKEGEVNIDEEKYLFLLNDILLNPVMSLVTERTGLSEGVIAFIDKQNMICEIFTSQDERRGEWGYNFFLNNAQYSKYLKEIDQVCKDAESFRKKLEKINLKNPTIFQIKEIFTKDIKNLMQAKVLTYFTIHPYSWKIEKSLNEDLMKIIPKEELEEATAILALQDDRDALETERRDWLENIVLFAVNKNLSFSKAKTDKKILNKINFHLSKYKTYPSGFDTDLWDVTHYLDLLKEDLNQNKEIVQSEFEQLKNKKTINENKKDEIKNKYKIGKDIVKKAQIIGKLANIRLDLRVKAWSFYLYIFRNLLDFYSGKINLSKKELGYLTFDEFAQILKDNKVKDETKRNIKERMQGDLLSISNPDGRFEILTGKIAAEKFNSEVKSVKKEKSSIIRGQVACRKGVVRGKVFTFRYGSPDFVKRISQFPQDAVLVANMTLPVLMPAIRKAKAMVTDAGGITSHSAIVSRELGIPCIIGTGTASKILKDGDEVEVDTDQGTVKILKRANE